MKPADRLDIAIGRAVRSKLVSMNPVPVERCVIRAQEIDTLSRKLFHKTLPQRALRLSHRLHTPRWRTWARWGI